jgi:capsular polysaccharide export protein
MTMARVAVFSRGLARLSEEVRIMSDFEPHFVWASANGFDAVAGWGHKPTAARARSAAQHSGLPYFAFEDGFLRSLKPGPAQRPVSMVMDRSGIYYDARQPSDLESTLQAGAITGEERAAARAVLKAIAAARLSKYNHGSDSLDGLNLPPQKKVVLVIDQTAGDESIAGGLADASSFERMAEAAARENPDAVLIAKLHPETLTGAKSGYIASAARRLGMRLLSSHVSPWTLLDLMPRVYTVSSQFGFEALLAGCPVTCFGVPFYAGWGLTDDRVALPRRSRQCSAEDIAAAVYLRYSCYFDAWLRKPVDVFTAIDQLSFLRKAYLSNARPVVGYRIARWKRRAVSAMLDGPSGPPRYTHRLSRALSLARGSQSAIAAWGTDALGLRSQLEASGLQCLAVEDGFLRSVGLGAAFVQPLSLVFDSRGLYYDATRPSDIEHLLSTSVVAPADTARAARLRERIVEARITKYNIAGAGTPLPALPGGRDIVLVPGQVADDAAVLVGRTAGFPPGRNVNAVLLERVRAARPDAFVIFKPHPDVEHLGRAGAVANEEAKRYADLVVRKASLEKLLPLAGYVETYSSLAGFEALLRGTAVTVHGMPFYAGWGLTHDRAVNPRRGRHRSLDELVAIALIHYPRYWDPVSGLACPPEVVLHRIAEARSVSRRPGLGLILGRGVILVKTIMRSIGRKHDGP